MIKKHRRPREHTRQVRTKRGRKRVLVNKGINPLQKTRRFLQRNPYELARQRTPLSKIERAESELEYVEKALTLEDLSPGTRAEYEAQQDVLLSILNPNPIEKIRAQQVRRKTILQDPSFRRTAKRLSELSSKEEPLHDYEILEFLDKRRQLDNISRDFRREQRKAVNQLNSSFKQGRLVRRKAPSTQETDDLFFNTFQTRANKRLKENDTNWKTEKARKTRARGEVYNIEELLDG